MATSDRFNVTGQMASRGPAAINRRLQRCGQPDPVGHRDQQPGAGTPSIPCPSPLMTSRPPYREWTGLEQRQIRPNDTDTATGPCGTSTLTLTDSGSKKYTISTGFNVEPPATEYTWETSVDGPAYAETFYWGGFLRNRSAWRNGAGASNGRGVSVPIGGAFAAEVPAGAGQAVLNNGTTCINGALFVSESIN